jgi:hypothetical protein
LFIILILIQLNRFCDKYQVYGAPSEYSSLQKLNTYISWKARSFYIEETETANKTYPEPAKFKLHNIFFLTLASILNPFMYVSLINVRVYRVAILSRNLS